MMKERIQELAEQAGYLSDAFGIGHWDMPECKKFVELIVQECVQHQEQQITDLRDALSDMIAAYGGGGVTESQSTKVRALNRACELLK